MLNAIIAVYLLHGFLLNSELKKSFSLIYNVEM